jgi:hypothetical protein
MSASVRMKGEVLLAFASPHGRRPPLRVRRRHRIVGLNADAVQEGKNLIDDDKTRRFFEPDFDEYGNLIPVMSENCEGLRIG